MKSLICGSILFWNSILAMIGRSIGLFLGGLMIGFSLGLKDQIEMHKYLRYKNYQIKKQIKDAENKEDGVSSDRHWKRKEDDDGTNGD